MKRILSIDGGGIKGVFPAAFLAKLEEGLHQPVGHYFDLIAGTSTGGIIALALGAGRSAKEVVGFYETYGPRIFANTGILATLKQFLIGKHESEPLRRALEAQFGEKRLGDSQARLVIPSQGLETGQVHIFKTAHDLRFQEDWKQKMVEVALSTSAAPTYFPTHKLPGGTGLIDGGIWANNPVGIAVVEAIGILKWKPEEINVLSISCTGSPMSTNAAHKWSLGNFYWAPKLMEVLSAGQSSGALGTAAVLLGGHERVIRIEPVVAPGTFGLDGVEVIERLRGLGEAEARKARPRLQHLFSNPVEPFRPFANEQRNDAGETQTDLDAWRHADSP